MTLVAVENCELQISSGTAEIKTDPSDDVFINDNGVYRGKIKIEVKNSMGDASNILDGDGEGSAELEGTGKNFLVDGKPAVLQGDKVTVKLKGHVTTQAGKTEVAGAAIVTIKKAGQDYVSAS